MSELMDWDGPWSPDLINLMIPVAVERLTKEEQAFGRSVISAVASFSDGKVWRNYSDSLRDILRDVRQEQLMARGATREDLRALAAEELVRFFKRMQGMNKK